VLGQRNKINHVNNYQRLRRKYAYFEAQKKAERRITSVTNVMQLKNNAVSVDRRSIQNEKQIKQISGSYRICCMITLLQLIFITVVTSATQSTGAVLSPQPVRGRAQNGKRTQTNNSLSRRYPRGD
jgi:hypothetical protein